MFYKFARNYNLLIFYIESSVTFERQIMALFRALTRSAKPAVEVTGVAPSFAYHKNVSVKKLNACHAMMQCCVYIIVI